MAHEHAHPRWAQIELAGIDPERREKLTTYLLASSHRMLACADQTHKISDRIIATSKTIEEIVGEYENFGCKDTQVLPIELREVVDGVAKTVSRGATPTCNWRLRNTRPWREPTAPLSGRSFRTCS